MMDSQFRFDQLFQKLHEQHYRMTPQRMALVRLIASSEGHPSAAQIYQQVKSKFPTMSQATVYKTLDLLKELGEVLEIPLRQDNHYDGNKPYPHPHLICLQCQKIMDGEVEPSVQKLVYEIEQNLNFQVIRHQLNFYGICTDCQAKARTEELSISS